MTSVYFTLEYALRVHDKILEISGGKAGFRNLGLLESIIAHVKNDDYYSTFEAKLTHIVYSVIMNHAFDDGNKRPALAFGSFFLGINGYGKRIGTFILEMEDIVVWVADKKIDKKLLFKIITSLINHGEISEEIKLQILSSIK